MTRNIYALRDTVADEFTPGLLTFTNDAAAARMFTDALQDKQSALGNHPGDYQLLEIGQLETTTGVLTPQAPRLVLTGEQWLLAQQQEK